MSWQLNMGFEPLLPADAYSYGARISGETHGVVLTRPHIVDLVLDLAGYTAERDLGALSLLEPACGHGAFLLAAVRRLLDSARRHGRRPAQLSGSVVAHDIDPAHVQRTRQALFTALCHEGVSQTSARQLSESWVRQGDFLLCAHSPRFDFIVGNPPYVRIEQLAPALQRAYRERYQSIYDRADLYVAFIEHGLNLLGKTGVLAYVCADRWTLNRYGAPLRRLIAERFQVRVYVDLHQTSPFESEVIAYPAIFSLSPGRTGAVQVARLATASPAECQGLRAALAGSPVSTLGVSLSGYPSWFTDDEPWVLSDPDQLGALRELEERFPSIEAGGQARVGIGVATGMDKVYIVGQDADIEPDRLLPLVMREDLQGGRIIDAHRSVINTFSETGEMIELRQYPRLSRYLLAHEAEVRKRHVAHKNPRSWFRTIDRVYPEWVTAPKLLIPDIAGSNQVVLDEGRYYPHHNLYVVTSQVWDMEVLGGLLSSRVALFFVWSYAVKMRGGYLRFQAQYLRRIRVPNPAELAPALAGEIRAAFRRRDFAALDLLALRAYGLAALPRFDFVDTRA